MAKLSRWSHAIDYTSNWASELAPTTLRRGLDLRRKPFSLLPFVELQAHGLSDASQGFNRRSRL